MDGVIRECDAIDVSTKDLRPRCQLSPRFLMAALDDDRPYYSLCVAYFLLFGSAAAIFPFLPVFFSSYVKFDEVQIGTLFAMQKVPCFAPLRP